MDGVDTSQTAIATTAPAVLTNIYRKNDNNNNVTLWPSPLKQVSSHHDTVNVVSCLVSDDCSHKQHQQ